MGPRWQPTGGPSIHSTGQGVHPFHLTAAPAQQPIVQYSTNNLGYLLAIVRGMKEKWFDLPQKTNRVTGVSCQIARRKERGSIGLPI